MSKIDMVTLQVIMNAFYSITDEMNMALIRTAYSTNIKDRRDCSCAVYTAAGEVISQTKGPRSQPSISKDSWCTFFRP